MKYTCTSVTNQWEFISENVNREWRIKWFFLLEFSNRKISWNSFYTSSWNDLELTPAPPLACARLCGTMARASGRGSRPRRPVARGRRRHLDGQHNSPPTWFFDEHDFWRSWHSSTLLLSSVDLRKSTEMSIMLSNVVQQHDHFCWLDVDLAVDRKWRQWQQDYYVLLHYTCANTKLTWHVSCKST